MIATTAAAMKTSTATTRTRERGNCRKRGYRHSNRYPSDHFSLSNVEVNGASKEQKVFQT
jgi:hypothetical protein